MSLIDAEQRHPEHRAVGGDEGQEDPQQAIEGRAALAHHHLGKLHHHGDHQNKGEGAQIGDIQRQQDIVLHQIGAGTGEGHHEGGRQPHADGGFQLAGDPHKGAEAEEFHQHEVVNQHGADQ